MNTFLTIIRFLSRHAWWWTVAFVIVLAVSLTAARLLLPQLGQYRVGLEMQVSLALGQPVEIGEFEVGWRGVGPYLVLHDVRLLDRSGAHTLLGFDELQANISVPGSLYRGKLQLGALTIAGLDLSFVRHPDGHYTVQGFDLPQQATGQSVGDGGKVVLAWLFSQGNLAIKNSTIHWHDMARGFGAVEFIDVSLNLHNRGQQHRLAGVMQLPPTMGGAVEVIIDALGDNSDLAAWQFDFYAKGERLQLTQWLADESVWGARMINGAAKTELWGSVAAGQLHSVKARLDIKDLSLAAVGEQSAPPQPINSLFAEFVWQGDANRWTLDVDRFHFLRGDKGWPSTRLSVSYMNAVDVREIEVGSSFARLEDLAELLGINTLVPETSRQLITDLAPRGDAQQLHFKFRRDEQKSLSYTGTAKVKAFAINPWKKMPGFSGLDVALNLDQSGGVAELTSQGFELDPQDLFRDRLRLDSLQGRLAWQKADDDWRLALQQFALANADAAMTIDGQIDFPADGQSPLVKLFADIERANAAAISTYLPVKIMPQKTVAWLDRAVVSGQVNSGAMILQGPIKRFPFDDNSGRFEVRVNLSNGILDYGVDWPRLEQLEAELGFSGRAMTAHSNNGKILTTAIGELRMGIADMRAKPALIELHGETFGPTSDVLRFLNQSPLHKHFALFTEDAAASGNCRLDLSLTIPLQADAKVATHGAVTFDGSDINFKRLGVDLEDINGRVGFTATGLEASAVVARVMGQPLQIDIHTDEANDESRIVFAAEGKTNLASLAQRVSLPVFSYLEGDAQWRARLEIPKAKEGVAPSLRIESDLSGVVINLPQPLAKPETDVQPLLLVAKFGDKVTNWDFNYGEQVLSGAFEILSGKDGQEINRGELHFSAAAQLPEEKGLRIAGEMPHFDLDSWWPVLFDRPDIDAGQSSLVNRLDLKMNTARLFGQSLHDFEVKADRLADAWMANVISPEFAGQVYIPNRQDELIEMHLQQLHLTSAEKKEPDQTLIDPRKLPPMKINSDQTSYNGTQYGALELLTARREDGLSIESLQTHSDVVDVKLTGNWTEIAGQQHTALNAGLTIHDMGSLLGGLGYVETVNKGDGSATLNLNWDGPLYDYDLATLNGEISMDLNDGRLLEIEPGAGRLFGLLSVQALPRRLTLDFSDFFGKGFTFDYMRGSFNIAEGSAVTEDFKFDGPGALIEVKGRVGLVARDYDQRVRVVPHVSSGLPLAGALAGGLSVGAAVLLVEKLLKPKIDEATEILYHVTGSWDEPVLTQLN